MTQRDTLLVEILTEELPPRSLAKLGEAFRDGVQRALADAGFIAGDNAGRYFATPRRLGVQFDEVLETQPERLLERKGPAVASGVDGSGKPTKALEGFMRSAGVVFEQLERARDGKAEYFVARVKKAGEAIDQRLAGFVEAALKRLPVAKIMRWGDGEAEFVRPVHGLIMLHGSRVVAGQVLGLTSSNMTRGHRFLSSGEILIAHASDYERALEKHGAVIASFATRRECIRSQLDAAQPDGAAWLHDEVLLDEVTALVENPAVYIAGFEQEFLQVPQECLILTMKQNQKYFPLLDSQGRLLNRFLIVSNQQTRDPTAIQRGNARVVRARLADAKFFYDQDRRVRLAERVDRLKNVVYHNKLGTQFERIERLQRLAVGIARRLNADAAEAARAALLAKADLVTDMVGEFPELQGIMGQYYARHDGEPEAVAQAIEMHYHPRFAGDSLPQGNVACSVALADKLDALVGFFGIGQVPTGDKDPYGLRRAALGLLRILAETPLPLDVLQLIDEAAANYPSGVLRSGFAGDLHAFILERLRHLLRDTGQPAEAIEAVLASTPARIDLVPLRLAAVREFAKLPEAEALAAANKRIVNILKKAPDRDAEPDVLLFQEDAERALFRQLNELAPLVRAQVGNEDYTAALKALAGLRAAVDHFFDKVMVMVDEPLMRQNRLALLKQLAGLMNQVADISRLSV